MHCHIYGDIYDNAFKEKINYNNKRKNLLFKKYEINNIEDIDIVIINKLKSELKNLTDPRQHFKSTYKIWDIVICKFLVLLSGYTTWYEIENFVQEHYWWIKTFLKLTGEFQDIYLMRE